jgi:hypothetical protein
MPQIIVATTTRAREPKDGVMLVERITLDDLESEHFTRHLLERLRWAVKDGHEAELARRSSRDADPVHALPDSISSIPRP